MGLLENIKANISGKIKEEVKAYQERDRAYTVEYRKAEKEALKIKARIDAFQNTGIQRKGSKQKKEGETKKNTRRDFSLLDISSPENKKIERYSPFRKF